MELIVGLLKALAVMILTVIGVFIAMLVILAMILVAGWIWMTWKEWHDEA